MFQLLYEPFFLPDATACDEDVLCELRHQLVPLSQPLSCFFFVSFPQALQPHAEKAGRTQRTG